MRKFPASFAADVDEEKAAFMADSQVSTVVEVAGSHAIFASQPSAVAALIKKAATGVKATAI